MNENLQIVGMILSFLTPPMGVLVFWLMLKIKQEQGETKKEIQTVAVDVKATKEVVVKQGEDLKETSIVAAEAKKMADGLTTMVAAAKLNEGIKTGELKERDRAEAKAEANPPVAESVKDIINEYKAGELKLDVAGLIEDVAVNPKATVDEIKKREGKP